MAALWGNLVDGFKETPLEHGLHLSAEVEKVSEGMAVLRLSGEIDLATASMITDRFAALVADDLPNVIIDATGITFIDSTGIQALVDGKRMIYEKGSRIVLIPSQPVRRLFDLVFQGQRYATRADSIEEAKTLLGSELQDDL